MIKRALSDFEDLTAAEEQLRDEIATGELVEIGDGVPPEGAGDDRTIRAVFLRYLMLGGCADLPGPVPETGVQIYGARVSGQLDLEGARCERELSLIACRIDVAPVLRSAQLDGLYLNESHLPGFKADRLTVRGGLMLRDAQVTGTLRLLGARIGGDIDCTNSTLTAGEDGNMLYADGAEVSGSVFLRDAQVTGTVRLLGARIGGDLACNNSMLTTGEDGNTLHADRAEVSGNVSLGDAQVTGTVRLLGARIGGNLECDRSTMTAGEDGGALRADGVKVEGGLFLRNGARVDGALDLTAAQIGHICDDWESWPKPGQLLLNRCRYGALTGRNVTAENRIAWLGLQDPSRFGKDFWPQPWEQCAKVLREMGHGDDARRVLIDKEKRQRRARRARASQVLRLFLWLSDGLMAVTTRYGRRPMLAFVWLLGLWIVGVGVFHMAERSGGLKPNNSFVLRSPEWFACDARYDPLDPALAIENPSPSRRAPDDGLTQLACFESQPEAASFPDFNRYVYSLDTLLPIVAMEMQENWLPDENVKPWGQTARVYLWVHIALGWALSLLAVAGFSGLIKTDNT